MSWKLTLGTTLIWHYHCPPTIAHSDPLVATERCMNPHSIDFMLDEDDDKKELILMTCFPLSLNCDSLKQAMIETGIIHLYNQPLLEESESVGAGYKVNPVHFTSRDPNCYQNIDDDIFDRNRHTQNQGNSS
jgi:hypothetical protein